jgi:hypothetical protein
VHQKTPRVRSLVSARPQVTFPPQREEFPACAGAPQSLGPLHKGEREPRHWTPEHASLEPEGNSAQHTPYRRWLRCHWPRGRGQPCPRRLRSLVSPPASR